uniref:Putative secreted protein n=1 Tax=Anopheles darlingi TaxID=43151 RepID=A0A2M4DK26_ANODA
MGLPRLRRRRLRRRSPHRVCVCCSAARICFAAKDYRHKANNYPPSPHGCWLVASSRLRMLSPGWQKDKTLNAHSLSAKRHNTSFVASYNECVVKQRSKWRFVGPNNRRKCFCRRPMVS